MWTLDPAALLAGCPAAAGWSGSAFSLSSYLGRFRSVLRIRSGSFRFRALVVVVAAMVVGRGCSAGVIPGGAVRRGGGCLSFGKSFVHETENFAVSAAASRRHVDASLDLFTRKSPRIWRDLLEKRALSARRLILWMVGV